MLLCAPADPLLASATHRSSSYYRTKPAEKKSGGGLQSMLKPVVNAEQAWAMLEEKVKCRYKSVKVSRTERPAPRADLPTAATRAR